jgi:hypothetical protein
VTEEQEDHQITRLMAIPGDLYVFDRIPDRDRTIELTSMATAAGTCARRSQAFLDEIDDLTAYARLALHRERDRAIIVVPVRNLVVLHAVDDARFRS